MTVIGQTDKPGTMLLSMLIKNEQEHLAQTLPNLKWAKIVDAWIIGTNPSPPPPLPRACARVYRNTH